MVVLLLNILLLGEMLLPSLVDVSSSVDFDPISWLIIVLFICSDQKYFYWRQFEVSYSEPLISEASC